MVREWMTDNRQSVSKNREKMRIFVGSFSAAVENSEEYN